LRFLSDVLRDYFKAKVMILIDEYDVPMENAYFNGFYEQMSQFVRSLLETALKTNPGLELTVMTGCLRISRESIFMGLNNLHVVSILSNQYHEYYGFNQQEVDALLCRYGIEADSAIVKNWYDGYVFGECRIYNPWSILSYTAEAIAGKHSFPKPYWANTSSNAIVKNHVRQSALSVKQELEELLSGRSIEKPVHEDITYDTMEDSQDNLWNFLFFTGYLRQESSRMVGAERCVTLAIPNLEVKYIYDHMIRGWFADEIKKKELSALYTAMLQGDTDSFQRELSAALHETISYLDTRELFYHGFMVGILGNLKDYLVKSNRETGDGRADLVIRSLDVSCTPVILELKAADTFVGMEAACEEALAQIEEKRYDAWLPEEGYTDVRRYGIAFFKKQCRVKTAYHVF
jgi:hypothetical protein